MAENEQGGGGETRRGGGRLEERKGRIADGSSAFTTSGATLRQSFGYASLGCPSISLRARLGTRLRTGLVKRLKKEGFWVRGVDLKYPEFSPTQADDFIIGDLSDPWICRYAVDQPFDEV